jgi:hypothetical protein
MMRLLLLFAVLFAARLHAADSFGYQTIDYPTHLLKPWKAERTLDLARCYSAEYGDGGGSLQLIAYPVTNEGSSRFHFTAIWIGPYSVATKPVVRVFEDLSLKNHVIKAGKTEFNFCQFEHPESKKLIRGVVIEGLFYEAAGLAGGN